MTSLSVLGFAACARGAQNATLAAPYIERGVAPVIPPLRGPIVDAATVLGLPQIGTVSLPEGMRELRVADDYSMFSGSAAPVLRLLQQPGRPIAGQVIFVWREHLSSQARYRATKCTPRTDSARTCVFVSPVSLDWTSVAARFDALDVWSISERCEFTSRTMPNGSVQTIMRHITDSGELNLGRIAGGASSIYTCNSPRNRKDTRDGTAAMLIYDYFRDVVTKAGGPPAA